MKIHNNRGELIAEINTGLTEDGERFTTNTIYGQAGNVVMQHISIRDNQGKVFSTNVIGTKILP
jgi:hypothetical protein